MSPSLHVLPREMGLLESNPMTSHQRPETTQGAERCCPESTAPWRPISYSVALGHDIYGPEQTQSNVGSEGKKPQRNCSEMRSTCLDYLTQKRSFWNDLQGTHSETAATGIFKTINQWNMKTGEKSMKVNAHLEPICLLMPGSKSLAQRGWAGEAPQQCALAHAEANRSLCLLYRKIFWVKVHNKIIVAEPNCVLSPKSLGDNLLN